MMSEEEVKPIEVTIKKEIEKPENVDEESSWGSYDRKAESYEDVEEDDYWDVLNE